MIPIDLIASMFVLVVAIYAAHYVYRAIRFSKVAPIGRALIFYLFVVAIDRIINTLSILISVSRPARVDNVIWCLYVVGITLIVWEIYNYLRSIQ